MPITRLDVRTRYTLARPVTKEPYATLRLRAGVQVAWAQKTIGVIELDGPRANIIGVKRRSPGLLVQRVTHHSRVVDSCRAVSNQRGALSPPSPGSPRHREVGGQAEPVGSPGAPHKRLRTTRHLRLRSSCVGVSSALADGGHRGEVIDPRVAPWCTSKTSALELGGQEYSLD